MLEQTALELMTILVKYTLDPIPPIYTGELFTRLMLVLLVTDDSAILQVCVFYTCFISIV